MPVKQEKLAAFKKPFEDAGMTTDSHKAEVLLDFIAKAFVEYFPSKDVEVFIDYIEFELDDH